MLRSFTEAPQLAAGCATVIVVAAFPPLWRRMMDRRVLEHYNGDYWLANVTPGIRAKPTPAPQDAGVESDQ
ncbi:hypothetical protein ABIA33_004958 [Streptacidiphilus sp. MAP12-16]|uniref:hypothetical protein n=1 Tax=Streptacidiphilus sp. MAP12-16 TaxID=3156300 RepID=UPI00351254B5